MPSQFIKGILMSVVLYPVLPLLTELPYGTQFLFMGGIIFVYTD